MTYQEYPWQQLKTCFAVFHHPITHASDSLERPQSEAACKRKQEQEQKLHKPKLSKRQRSKSQCSASVAKKKQNLEQEAPTPKAKEKPKPMQKSQAKKQKTNSQARKPSTLPDRVSLPPNLRPAPVTEDGRGRIASVPQAKTQQGLKSSKAALKPISQLMRVKRLDGQSLVSKCPLSLPRSPPVLNRNAFTEQKKLPLPAAASGRKLAKPDAKQPKASFPGKRNLRTLRKTSVASAPQTESIKSKPGGKLPSSSHSKAPFPTKSVSKQLPRAIVKKPSEQSVQDCLKAYFPPLQGFSETEKPSSPEKTANQWQNFQQPAQVSDENAAKSNPTRSSNPAPPETPAQSLIRQTAVEGKDFASPSEFSDGHLPSLCKDDTKDEVLEQSRQRLAAAAADVQQATKKLRALMEEISKLEKDSKSLSNAVAAKEGGQKHGSGASSISCSKLVKLPVASPVVDRSAAVSEQRMVSSKELQNLKRNKLKPPSGNLRTALGIQSTESANFQSPGKQVKQGSHRQQKAKKLPSLPADSPETAFAAMPYSQCELAAEQSSGHTPRTADHRHTSLPRSNGQRNRALRKGLPPGELMVMSQTKQKQVMILLWTL